MTNTPLNYFDGSQSGPFSQSSYAAAPQPGANNQLPTYPASSGAYPPPPNPYAAYGAISPKSRVAALLLCIFLGQFGGHRFYVGKIGTGIVWLLTFGFLGFAVIFDIIMICVGSFSDSDGLKVLRWGD